jgi:hypothetical protein
METLADRIQPTKPGTRSAKFDSRFPESIHCTVDLGTHYKDGLFFQPDATEHVLYLLYPRSCNTSCRTSKPYHGESCPITRPVYRSFVDTYRRLRSCFRASAHSSAVMA